MHDLTRRSVLTGACGTCAAVLSGCATYTSGGVAPAPAAAPAPSAGVLPTAAGPRGVEPSSAPAAGNGLAATADIPVGGGKIFGDQDLVVTQPVAGTFVAFSATCTHQGCAVTTVTAEGINCPCHGSSFAVVDGSPIAGPAQSPLPERSITVAGGQISLA